MTIIVGVLDGKGGCYMGGDSAGVGEDELQLRKDTKVFTVGSYLIGVCGSWRVNQLLRFSQPPKPSRSDPFKFMVTKFVPFLRELIKNEKDDTATRPSFLIAFHGRLFHVFADMQISEEILPYEAAGSGAQIARGAMFASALAPKAKVQIALEAAERFNSNVRSPFHTFHQKS